MVCSWEDSSSGLVEDVFEQTAVLDEGATEDQGCDSHELDQDVDRRSTCVLHRVSHGVTDDSRLVCFGVLPLHLAIYDEPTSFNVLLGVVPGAT